MKYTLRVIAIISVLSACLMLNDLVRAARLPERAKAIKVGDSKNQVIRILGNADDVFGPDPNGGWFSHPMETWVYGSWLETNDPFYDGFPWFFPLRFRLLWADPEDVTIEFDDDGKVLEIRIPDDES
jgi:hypothetical protein